MSVTRRHLVAVNPLRDRNPFANARHELINEMGEAVYRFLELEEQIHETIARARQAVPEPDFIVRIVSSEELVPNRYEYTVVRAFLSDNDDGYVDIEPSFIAYNLAEVGNTDEVVNGADAIGTINNAIVTALPVGALSNGTTFVRAWLMNVGGTTYGYFDRVMALSVECA